MSNVRYVVSAPSYAKQFECIGSSCPDSCCTNWRVDVDKATYQKLIHLPVSDVSKRVIAALEKRTPSTKSQYAKIRMSSGECVALTEKKLCGIQALHGESYLPNVCHFFPRHVFATGLGHEMHLSLACPEAARLCVEDEEPAMMTEVSVEVPRGKSFTTQGGFRVGRPEQLLTAYPKVFTLIRNFIERVLRADDLAPWQQLLLIQYATEKIDKLRSDCHGKWPEGEIERILLELMLGMLDGSFQAQTHSLTISNKTTELTGKFVEEMTNFRVRMGGLSSNGRQFFSLVAEAFDAYSADRESNGHLGEAAACPPFNALALRAAKNFLRNQIGVKNFPSLDAVSMSSQWREIVATYALVVFYLRWLAVARGEEFKTEQAVQVIQGFTKLATHNARFLPELRAQLSSAGLDGVAGLVILSQ